MPVFVDNRSVGVTRNSETTYTGPKKSVFPGARPASVSTDPLRDGDHGAAKAVFPSGRPASITTDPVRDLAKPSAPTSVVGTKGSTTVSVAFTPGKIPGDTYTVTITPGGKTASGTASPIVVTGLTNGTAYTAKVVGANTHGNGKASTASAAFTPS